MEKSHNRISIIIPIYNAESYLVKCLESVINQTYSDLEVILINDGSTDASIDIIDDYASKDDRIIVRHKKNGGIGSAYKVAFDIMTGDYVLFVDSDDWLELNAVEELLRLAVDNKVDMVSFGIKPQTVNGMSIDLKTFNNIDLINTDNESILKTHFEVLKHPTLVRLYKRILFKDVRIFEQNIGIDEMLTPQLIVNCNRAAYTSKVYYNVLIRQESVCRSEISNEKVLQVIKVYNFILTFFSKNLKSYEYQFTLKYYNVLKGYFYETFGKINYETYSDLITELRVLKKSGHINAKVSNKNQELLLNLFLKLNIKISFPIAKILKLTTNK